MADVTLGKTKITVNKNGFGSESFGGRGGNAVKKGV